MLILSRSELISFRPELFKKKKIEAAVREYLQMWSNGKSRRKLFPGFHPGIYQEIHGNVHSLDPLADYIREGQPIGPWSLDVISS